MTRYENLAALTRMLDCRIHLVNYLNIDYRGPIVCGFNVLSAVLKNDGDAGAWYQESGGGERVMMKPRHIYLIPASRKILAVRTPEVRTLTVHFELRLLNGPDIFSEKTPIREWRDEPFLEKLERIVADPNPMRAAMMLKGTLMEFLAPAVPEDALEKTRLLPRYEPLFRYAEMHCSAALRVADLADFFHLRADQFSRQFRRDLGMTPKAYLDGILLRRILSELHFPRPGLKYAADRLGFPNEYALSRFFKRAAGFAPREYLRRSLDLSGGFSEPV